MRPEQKWLFFRAAIGLIAFTALLAVGKTIFDILLEDALSNLPKPILFLFGLIIGIPLVVYGIWWLKTRYEQKKREFAQLEYNHILEITTEDPPGEARSPKLLPSIVEKPIVADKPFLLCLAIDVSQSMKKPIFDHTGKAIQRWTSIKQVLEEFVHLGTAWMNDPETRRILPSYYLMAYGFGFREAMHQLALRQTPGGAIRDLLAYPDDPSLPALPSAIELEERWEEYKAHLLSMKNYTGDLFGETPMRAALEVIQKRIEEEQGKRNFALPVFLLIISDGLSSDGSPLSSIEKLQKMGVMTLCCYLAENDVLAPRKLYLEEDPDWSDGARHLFRCASVLRRENAVEQRMFEYLTRHGWQPRDGVRLFVQVNQTEALGNFLKILLQGTFHERTV